MKRKFAILFITGVMTLSMLCGCGTDTTQTESKPNETTVAVAEVVTTASGSGNNTEATASETQAAETEATKETEALKVQESDIAVANYIPTEVIDLTTGKDSENTQKLLNESWYVEEPDFTKLSEDDLDVMVLNRKITLTGTTMGDFLKSFDGFNEYLVIENIDFEHELHPYNSIEYSIKFSDEYLHIVGYNTTESVITFAEIPIYSVTLSKNDIESIVSRDTSYNGTKRGRNGETDFDVSYTFDDSSAIINLQVSEEIFEYVKSLSKNELPDAKSDAIGDGYIEVLGTTFDIRANSIPDAAKVFGYQGAFEIPYFYNDLDLTYLTYGTEPSYDLIGDGLLIFNTKDSDVHVQFSTFAVYRGDLWDVPLKGIYVNCEDSKIGSDGFRLAGQANATSREDMLSWVESEVKSKTTNLMEDGVEDKEEISFSAYCEDAHLLEIYKSGDFYDLYPDYSYSNAELTYVYEFDSSIMGNVADNISSVSLRRDLAW